MKKLLASLCLAVLPLASACSNAPETTPSTTLPVASQASTPNDEASEAFLAKHGLEGKSVKEIVNSLDATNDDRESGPYGSVRPTELVLSDDDNEVTLPIRDGFYLSIAPYVTQTHECYNHNLASCQGELADTELDDVTITSANGEQLYAGAVRTGPNGFAGFWLPSDTAVTVTVNYDGRSATQSVSTGSDDPTCITTLRLA